MKKFILSLLLLLFASVTVRAQGPVPGQTVTSFDGQYLYYTDVQGITHRLAIVPLQGSGAPPNPCVNSTAYADVTSNNFYVCINNVWVQINGASNPVLFNPHTFSGNGTVSSAFPVATVIGSSDVSPSLFAADSGVAANAYVVNPTPAVTALTAGTLVTFVTTNANTGASTVNVSGLGVKNLTKSGGIALSLGDIKSSTPILIEYNTAISPAGWELVSGSASPGSPVNSVQCNKGIFTACNATDDGTTFTITDDASYVGPNPGVYITAKNARAVNPNATPAAVGITANCNSVTNPTQVTLSTAGGLQNNDGLVLYGCGATQSMSTPGAPTVTPAIALTGTGTGIISTSVPTGATTMNYKIIARDKNGGMTAASTGGTTTTGNTLGEQTVNITSWTRTNDGMTATTASAHGFLPGCTFFTCGEVFLSAANSLTDTSFAGWYPVSSAADNTHFTIATTFFDARNGASSSATGGTASWYNANHLTWSAVTGAWEFYIYCDRANSGTFTLCGVSRPQGTSNTDLTWDDFGATMMGNFTFPPYVPTAPPAVATSDHLSTTITAGGGTTAITVANPALTTISGATARIDACPGFIAAAQAINANGVHGGTLVIPSTSGNQFVVNSYCDLTPYNIAIDQRGPLYLNETLATKAKWYGDRVPQFGSQSTQFTWQGSSIITVDKANPGIYNPQQSGTLLKGISLAGLTNGALLALYEGGFNMSFLDDSFSTTTNAGDYMGIGLYLRGKSMVQSAANIIIDRTLFSAGGGLASVDGANHTPIWYCNDCGGGDVRSAFYTHRGAVIRFDPAGGSFDFKQSYIQGSANPLYTITGGSNNWNAIFRQVTLDTVAHPCIATFSGGPGVFFPQGQCSPSSGIPPVTGLRVPVIGLTSLASSTTLPNTASMGPVCQPGAADGIFGLNYPNYCMNASNAALATGTSYPIFVNGVPPAAPTGAVNTGGSVAVGNYVFLLVPKWQNNGEGVYSPPSVTFTTSSGNQTIALSWPNPAVPGNPKGYNLYWCSGAPSNGCSQSTTFGNPQSPTSTGITLTTPLDTGAGASDGESVPTGGPTMALPGTGGFAAPAFVTTGPSGFASTSSGSFTANRSVTQPDASGTGMLYTGSFNNNECVQANVTAGITTFKSTGGTCPGGGSGPTIQTNGVNNTSQTALNFVTSTSNSMGITVTPSNPSTGNERFEATGTVNAASGGLGLNSPAAHSFVVAEGSSPFNVVTSPSTNGFYDCGFNVVASVGVDPTCILPGVNVVKPSTPYTMLYSDRFTYQFLTGGTTFTINLPQIIGNTASNFGFVTANFNTGNLTETANAADDIDSSALGGSSTVLPNFAAFNYSETATGPGHWHTIKFPTFAAFPACTNALQFSTSTGFSCSSSFGTVTSVGLTQTGSIFSITGSPVTTSGNINLAFVNFGTHQWFGNNGTSSAAPTAELIGSSDVTTNIYAADTGAVNAYVIAPSPAVTALTVGTIVTFTTANANTGASTINVSSLGVKNITKGGGTALASGDIKANAPIMIEYNTAIGTPGWELVSGAGASGSGTVTSVDGSAGNGVQTIQSSSVTACTTACTIQGSDLVNSQTGTTYTIATGDRGHVIVQTNAAAIADTLPQATSGATSNFAPGWFCEVFNTGLTNVTITPTTSTINGRATLVVPGGTWVKIISDGTNYDALVENGAPSKVNLTATTAQANSTSDQALQEISLPAGYLNVLNQPFWVHGSGIYTIAAAQTPTLQYKVKLCTVSGCGSGTVITLASITSGATISLTNNNWNLNVLAVTNATGATGNFLVHGNPGLSLDLLASSSGADTVYGDTNTAVSSSIDLTAALFVDFTVATSTGNVGNQITQQIGSVMPQSNPAGGSGGTPVTATSLPSNIPAIGNGGTSLSSGFTGTPGTVTSGHLACYTSSGTVGNCTGLSGIIGVFTGASSWTSSGETPVTLDATVNVTFGDNLCASSTSFGTAHDNGATACTTGLGIGIVKTTASSVSSATAFVALR